VTIDTFKKLTGVKINKIMRCLNKVDHKLKYSVETKVLAYRNDEKDFANLTMQEVLWLSSVIDVNPVRMQVIKDHYLPIDNIEN